MKRNPPPRGKMLLIGSEDVEVYPQFCGDGHKCIQCYFNGKYLCSPRFWLYPTLEEFSGYPVSPRGEVFMPFGLEARLPDESLHSGKIRLVREEPYRITDASCYKCGYPYLGIDREATPRNHWRKKDRYKCLQCGSVQLQNTTKPPIHRIKRLVGELWGQDITHEAAIEIIQQRVGYRINRVTYRSYAKAMGLPPRKPGRQYMRGR